MNKKGNGGKNPELLKEEYKTAANKYIEDILFLIEDKGKKLELFKEKYKTAAIDVLLDTTLSDTKMDNLWQKLKI